MHKGEEVSAQTRVESSGLGITQAVSASQNITNSIQHEKCSECPPCLAHKLRHSCKVKDWWILNKTFKISDGTRSLMTRDISCKLDEANYTRLNSGMRLRPSCIPPIDTVLHGVQTERLWDCNYGRRNLELSTGKFSKHASLLRVSEFSETETSLE